MDSLSLVVADLLSSHTSQGKTTSSQRKRCLGKAQVVGWERDEATRKFNNKVNTRINMLLARKASYVFAQVCVCLDFLLSLHVVGIENQRFALRFIGESAEPASFGVVSFASFENTLCQPAQWPPKHMWPQQLRDIRTSRSTKRTNERMSQPRMSPPTLNMRRE